MAFSCTYFMVDVEASGSSPGMYSMLSLGCAVIGAPERSFYRELQPISMGYILSALRIGALHLEANRGNAASGPNFDPEQCLRNLQRRGLHPGTAMEQFRDWVLAEAGGGIAKFVSDTPDKDGMFVRWYFDNYCARPYPFDGAGLSMNCFCRGKAGDMGTTLKRTAGGKRGKRAHHSGYDAREQAEWAATVLPPQCVRRS